MRRAERLFQMVQFLRRRRRAVTAQVIAEHFGICERTVYRDLQSLMASGVPVSGAAGVGYLFDRKYELPPVMFNSEELEALALGASMITHWTDEVFAQRAKSAIGKIEAVLPDALQSQIQDEVLFSYPSCARLPWEVSFSQIRDSIGRQLKLRFAYKDESGKSSKRTVRPLGMVFFGPVWLLLSWCEKRQDFRSFRLDRISSIEYLNEHFAAEAGTTLKDYSAKEGC